MLGLKIAWLLLALANTDPTMDFTATYEANPDADTVVLNAEFIPEVEFKNTAFDLYGVVAPSIDGACEHERQVARAGRREIEDFLTRPNQRIILNFSGEVRQTENDIVPLVYIAALDETSREDLATRLLDLGLVRHPDVPGTQWCIGEP